jgi:ketosteroid isomerase-like protein
MSQENVDLIRRGYDRWLETGDPVFDFFDPQIEWHGPREFPDLAEPHYGHDGVRRYLEKVNEAFDDYRMVPEEFIDAGEDQVLVFSREGGRGKGSGAAVQTNPTAHLWTLRNGKAIRMQSYWERADALKAAGLSE